ncbi:MAG: protein-L-isoaspartate(D-aspartate) O-methyltransferase [Acholeplasmataceae bacterium]|nr:protein-L-isoaspartate(D-aspartate) O-methyltransferase [Acholeplasmataceae bacterium]
MVDTQLKARGIQSQATLAAFYSVPRHLFVDQEDMPWAYHDHPLPIGSNQTISQPYIVALMTEALQLGKEDKVLEVGTGSGYQTAILSLMTKSVYTIERIRSLQEKAKKILSQLDYQNIKFFVGNGYNGWPEHGPYQAIIVTASPNEIPKMLFDQLDEGGRMVLPVGYWGIQRLYQITKIKGQAIKKFICECRFVPMVRD